MYEGWNVGDPMPQAAQQYAREQEARASELSAIEARNRQASQAALDASQTPIADEPLVDRADPLMDIMTHRPLAPSSSQPRALRNIQARIVMTAGITTTLFAFASHNVVIVLLGVVICFLACALRLVRMFEPKPTNARLSPYRDTNWDVLFAIGLISTLYAFLSEAYLYAFSGILVCLIALRLRTLRVSVSTSAEMDAVLIAQYNKDVAAYRSALRSTAGSRDVAQAAGIRMASQTPRPPKRPKLWVDRRR